jgi:2',3'-cyclic-nucleotide 2'-phosphodiesterase
MRILFIADIVGPAAAQWVASHLASMRAQLQVDLAIVNPDNASVTGAMAMTGSGVQREVVDRLLEAGADVISPGSHIFDGADARSTLADPCVIRAANLAPELPGRGAMQVQIDGETVNVVQLAQVSPELVARGTYPMPTRTLWQAWRALQLSGTTVVHLVSDSAHLTRVFAHAVDGEAAVVLGTLSHIASRDHEILPAGTGVVPDVGYTGPAGGIGGFPPDQFVAELEGRDPAECGAYTILDGPLQLGAAIVEVIDGRTSSIECLDMTDVEAAFHTSA